MIYITGDTHCDFTRFSESNFPEQKDMTKNDVVIICGDFGGIWEQHENRKEKARFQSLTDLPFTLVFCDGNHENFERLNRYPETEWMGGKVHVIREGLYHLERGECYTIEGKKFFVFGGAPSHDISDGILDPADFTDDIYGTDFQEAYEKLVNARAMFRVKGHSWWPEEIPSDAEYAHGLETLEKIGHTVDFIITHEGPAEDIAQFFGGNFDINPVMQYLQKIKETTRYKHWFFGHHHDNINISDTDHMVFETITQIV